MNRPVGDVAQTGVFFELIELQKNVVRDVNGIFVSVSQLEQCIGVFQQDIRVHYIVLGVLHVATFLETKLLKNCFWVRAF
jgi:hypothetical protein